MKKILVLLLMIATCFLSACIIHEEPSDSKSSTTEPVFSLKTDSKIAVQGYYPNLDTTTTTFPFYLTTISDNPTIETYLCDEEGNKIQELSHTLSRFESKTTISAIVGPIDVLYKGSVFYVKCTVTDLDEIKEISYRIHFNSNADKELSMVFGTPSFSIVSEDVYTLRIQCVIQNPGTVTEAHFYMANEDGTNQMDLGSTALTASYSINQSIAYYTYTIKASDIGKTYLFTCSLDETPEKATQNVTIIPRQKQLIYKNVYISEDGTKAFLAIEGTHLFYSFFTLSSNQEIDDKSFFINVDGVKYYNFGLMTFYGETAFGSDKYKMKLEYPGQNTQEFLIYGEIDNFTIQSDDSSFKWNGNYSAATQEVVNNILPLPKDDSAIWYDHPLD